METEYDRYDCLRYELFETLIPAMLYKGTEKERDEFFGFLKQDGKVFIHDMYQTLCAVKYGHTGSVSKVFPHHFIEHLSRFCVRLKE